MIVSQKHVPFNSVFRPDFEVVEERRGNFSIFPHTDQLPLLHRALNLEFYNALPDYIARVDKRGNGFQKNLLKHASLTFCSMFNANRADGLHLESLPDLDLVSRLAVVQQLTEHTRRGKLHRFKFYAGADFSPEIRVSGRRIAFTDHALERFTERMPNELGGQLSFLLLVFFGSPLLAVPVGGQTTFIQPYLESLLAFPFEVVNDEIIITTCLSLQQINSLERQIPPLAFNTHYGEKYEIPKVRHWLPTKMMLDYFAIWERKVSPSPIKALDPRLRWHRCAQLIRDNELNKGHGPGTKFVFFDNIPGPYAVEYLPSQPEPQINERQFHKDIPPHRDNWDAIFDGRDYYVLNLENQPAPGHKPPASAP